MRDVGHQMDHGPSNGRVCARGGGGTAERAGDKTFLCTPGNRVRKKQVTFWRTWFPPWQQKPFKTRSVHETEQTMG